MSWQKSLGVPKRTLLSALLVLLAYGAGFFSLYVQLDPFIGVSPALPLLSAGSGAGFAVAGFAVAGPHPPRGFALVGVGLNAAVATLAAIVLAYT